MGNQVERDPVDECPRRDRLIVEHLPGLENQLLHSFGACSAGRLISGGDETAELLRPVERSNRHEHDRGRAVRIGDDPLVPFDILGVDLGHHQRHILVHAEGAGVVDHHRSGGDHRGTERAGDVAARAEQRDVDAAERGFGHLFDRNILALELQRLAGRAGRSEKFQIFDGEVAFFQCLDHFDADRAGRAGDRDIVTVRHFTVFPWF